VGSSVPMAISPLSVAQDLRENGDVVDLLISMAVSGVTSTRRELIFEPL
jgi:hypothetical protein